ncbi:MAG TPA: ABC transporter substrate-binding protein [Ktedonobacterales bacterium]|nr:ABC transporter substrate-binding protein [Ktedonobacterales bacterium]
MSSQTNEAPHWQRIDPRTRPFLRVAQLFSICCAALLVVGFLAGCGGSSSSGKITLTEMDYWSNDPQNSAVNQLISLYEKSHPNVTIQRDAVPNGSLLAKADQEAASHTLPDLLLLDNPWVANFASTGALAPLDSYMQGAYSSSDFYPGPYSTMTYNGHVYAFSVGNNDLALFYNKKLFSKAGLTPPATWADLATDAKKLSSGNTYGLAIAAAATEEGSWQFEPFLWSNKATLTNVDSAQGVQALQFLTTLVQQGSLSKAAVNWGQGDITTQFENGYAAMMLMGAWDIAGLNQQSGLEYGIVPVPVPQAGYSPVSPIGGEAWTVPLTDTAHEQAAWDFINWFEQPAQLNTFDQLNNYIPPLKSDAQTFLANNPDLSVFANEMATAQARTATVGAKYPQVSQQLWTAEQAALTGSMTPAAALQRAQSQITTILQG